MDFFRADGVAFSKMFTIFVFQETKWKTDYEQVYPEKVEGTIPTVAEIEAKLSE